MDQNIFQTVYKVNHAGGSGSCFYLKKHDLFVTNYHVVEGFRQVALEDNQKNRYLANIVLVNPILDIALLSAAIFPLYRKSAWPVPKSRWAKKST